MLEIKNYILIHFLIISSILLGLVLVRTHHGDAVNFNSYFIFVSDRHYTHIFHILLMVICLFTDIIS